MTWPNFVTWLLVFLGWAAVHRATLARDRRKEKRELSTKICTQLDELQTVAIDFHTASHFSALKSTDLAQDVEQIIIRMQKAPLSELNIPMARLIALRRRITKHNTDQSDFKTQPADSQIVFGIRNAVTDLIICIEDSREQVWE